MRRSNRSVAVTVAGIVTFLNLYSVQSLLPTLADQFGASLAQTGLAITATLLAVAMMAPLAGWISDMLGRKRLIVSATWALTVPTLLSGFAPSLPILIVYRLLQGLLLPFMFIVTVTYIGDEAEGAEALRLVGTYSAGSIFGGFAGRFIAGIAAYAAGWRVSFFVLAALTGLAGLILMAALPLERHFRPVSGLASSLQSFAEHLGNRRLGGTYVIGFTVLFSIVAAFTYGNFVLAARPYELGPAELGSVFVVYLLGMVSSPMAARLANSIGRRPTLGVAACTGASGMLLTLVPSLVAFIAGLALLAAAVFVEQTLSIGFVSIAAERAKSTAVGLYVTCYYAGGSLGGIVPAGIWQRAGWPGCAALIVLTQASMLLLASMAWSGRRLGTAVRATPFEFLAKGQANMSDAMRELHKFAIGQPVSRKEDPILLRGEGRYTDDINLPGQAYAVMLRSRQAHGRILGIDTEQARSMPGVVAAYTGADLLAAGYGNMPTGPLMHNRDRSPMRRPPQPPLTTDRMRYVGDPVACIVAETFKQARDAAEIVQLDIEALPAVTTASAAAAPDAPLLHEAAPGNLALDYHYGDPEKIADAFARAAHVTRLVIRNSRVVVCPLEPRSAIGEYDPASERWTLHLGCQGVFGMRDLLKGVLQVPREKVRVLTGNVGGSFGMKSSCFPEYICILHAARALGRPVKWTDDRSESFLSDSHGLDHERVIELALDEDANFLAVRVTGYGNLGSYLSNATTWPSTVNTLKNVVGVYRTKLAEVSTQCMFTNTTPVGPYRGAGRPEGNYYMERVIDVAAAELGIDKVELRKRNHIRPEEIPYRAPS
ncbi:MAG: MFS transporter, partial [Acetobacteraceae bacterium]|nr:MFS transporter [Acetobacteraceae bacterium]